MKKLTSYEIVRHGVEWSDYFQGCGVSFTEFDEVSTGIGDTEKEAFDDAIEQIVNVFSLDDGSLARLEWDAEHKEWDPRDAHEASGADSEDSGEQDSPLWHVSIRYCAEEVPQ